jgi:hypothetical protein
VLDWSLDEPDHGIRANIETQKQALLAQRSASVA